METIKETTTNAPEKAPSNKNSWAPSCPILFFLNLQQTTTKSADEREMTKTSQSAPNSDGLQGAPTELKFLWRPEPLSYNMI